MSVHDHNFGDGRGDAPRKTPLRPHQRTALGFLAFAFLAPVILALRYLM